MKSRSRSKVRSVRCADRTSRRDVPTAVSRRRPSPRKTADRPFVSATFAMTVDGKVTTRDFTPVDFTSREDKQHLFRQRARADAVIIGHSTLKRDNVRLGVPEDLRQARIKRGQTPAPLRVIVSNAGKIDHQLKIFQADPEIGRASCRKRVEISGAGGR